MVGDWTYYPPLAQVPFRWNRVTIGPAGVICRILLRTPKPPLGWIDYDKLTVALATRGRKKKREGR